MSRATETLELFNRTNPEHMGLLGDSLRAPSAHNAQPWQIRPLNDKRTYELHYDQSDDLPHDRDEKDAYMSMGALVETLVLQAPRHGYNVAVKPELTRDGRDLFIATVAIDNLEPGVDIDPLSVLVGDRHTNRNAYKKDPLNPYLVAELEALGNTLVDPKLLKKPLMDASVRTWADPQYIKDLEAWFRKDNSAEDGITPAPFNISRMDMVGLKYAFWRGSITSKALGQAFSSRDVKLFTQSPGAAVLSVPEKTPPELFKAGRNLLRSWVRITGEDYSYQPFSIGVDDEIAADQIAEIAGVENPVALYRIGKAAKPPRGFSNRKPLHKVLIK